MALEGHKMCGTMDGANNNCVVRFPRRQHWREAMCSKICQVAFA